jgi:hypothetical protein
MLKYVMEILLSESSVVTTYYFSWSTSVVAIFLTILGLTVLPENAIVGTYITNLFEDKYLLSAFAEQTTSKFSSSTEVISQPIHSLCQGRPALG